MVTYPRVTACPMTVIPVADPHDPRLALYRHIRDANLVREHGLFVAEGRLIVERMAADPRYVIESLLLNESSWRALSPTLTVAAPDAPVFLCETSSFAAITGFDIHRGCLALVQRPPERAWEDAVADARLVVVLEAVTNADNVGGVFRNVAAFGADAVLLSPTSCDPLYRKAIRTSMGAALQVPFARIDPWPIALRDLRARGFTLVALSPREPSAALDAFATSAAAAGRLALIVGTEGPGLSDAVEQCVDVRVRIPIRPAVDSLNLAVATGVALSRLGSA